MLRVLTSRAMPPWLGLSTVLGLSYREHKTNEYVWQQVHILSGRQELSLSTVKCRKLSWFSHVCLHDTLPKIALRGKVYGSRHSLALLIDYLQIVRIVADYDVYINY